MSLVVLPRQLPTGLTMSSSWGRWLHKATGVGEGSEALLSLLTHLPGHSLHFGPHTC